MLNIYYSTVEVSRRTVVGFVESWTAYAEPVVEMALRYEEDLNEAV